MELQQAILGRRTIKDFRPDEVPLELIEQALEAGIWAANHRLTQPWRFAVLGTQTREQMATGFPKIREKPVVVAVSCLKSDGGEQEFEDLLAVAGAIQNIHLRAHDLGLGMQWSSGKAALHPQNYAMLGIENTQEILMGLLFFGFPLHVPPGRERKPLGEVCRFLP